MRIQTLGIRIVQFVLIALILTSLGWFTFVVLRPAWSGYLLTIAGRNADCSAGDAADGIQNHLDCNIATEKMSHQKLVRAAGGFELWSTPRGDWWLPAGSSVSENLAVLLAQQETDLYGTGKNGPQPGDIVLDCGAHVGVFVRKALARGAAKVVAIEPNPENVECLRRNFIREIETGQVTVYAKGVWDKEDFLVFHRPKDQSAGGSFLLQSTVGDRPVSGIPVTTIDKLVAELNLVRVDFIKTDIKGATTRALRGARETILKHKPRMAISTEEVGYDDPKEIFDVLHGIWPGYHAQCGSCMVTHFRVYPEVQYFRP
jgi:FkbM family methyltransferase